MFKRVFYGFVFGSILGQSLAMETPIHELYDRQQLKFQDAFFKLDHPHWTPENLPHEVSLKLHHWFLEGHSISIPEGQNWSKDEVAVINRKFKLLFSAGCLGHQMAAIEAGGMLLDPKYNDFLPLVICFDDLEPEAKKYDVKRLNQPLSDNEKLNKLIEEFEEFSDGEEKDDETEYQTSIEKFEIIIPRLAALDQTLEVQATTLALKEMQDHLIQHHNLDYFVSRSAKEFVQESGLRFPLLNQFFLDPEGVSDMSADQLSIMRSDYLNNLNYETISCYCDALEPQYSVSEREIGKPNTFNIKYKTSNEACTLLEMVIEMKRIAILLGNQNYCFIPKPDSVIDDGVPVNYQWQQDRDTHLKIDAFLGYLLLVRNPTPSQYRKARELLSSGLGGPENAAKNNLRFTQLEEKYKGSGHYKS